MLYTVKDFSKPENCNGCYLKDSCSACNSVETGSDGFPRWCPLIPVVPLSVIEGIREEIESMVLKLDRSVSGTDTRTDEQKAADWWEMERLRYRKTVGFQGYQRP